MPKGRILVVEADEWEQTLLARFLGGPGFEVYLAAEARAGFEQARALQPDCILCDVSLPDIDGFWVARRVRTEPSPVASVPFLFLTDPGDRESQLQGLNVGADSCLVRPFHDQEVVAQVSALIDMATRLKTQRESFESEGPVSAAGVAFQGDIAQMSLATVLTLLELERQSGQLKVRSDTGKVALLELNEGSIAGAWLDDQPHEATPVLRETLRWKNGRFTFRRAGALPQRGSRQTIGSLLIEATRLEDESRRRP